MRYIQVNTFCMKKSKSMPMLWCYRYSYKVVLRLSKCLNILRDGVPKYYESINDLFINLKNILL